MALDGSRGMNDPLDYLSEAWRVLRLSVRCPTRVAAWDAIVLTAASPAQAELFQGHLEQSQRNGMIAKETVVLAVPDPEGRRIGSGAATLCALRALAHHLQKLSEISSTRLCSEDALLHKYGLGMRVLLLHTGGDSKRVPWANPIGKAFIPLPFLGADDPDGPILTLFDHILAISACALQSFFNNGGLLIMTGDVLPCFDAASLSLPENGAVVVTVPTSLARAAKHGVILASQRIGDPHTDPPLVEDLLQKPSVKEMRERGAILEDGRALLDTGIFAICGAALHDLIMFALADPDPVADLLANGDEMSLYEEIAGAWVPGRHKWLESRPLGRKLINALGSNRLYHHCAEDLKFLHFGTSSEVLDHLAEDHMGRVAKHQFSAIPAATMCEVAPSAVLIGCDVHPGVSVGEGSLVFSCTLMEGTCIGARCVATGLYHQEAEDSSQFVLPDRHCLWQVPVTFKATSAHMTLCCGLDDDPKVTMALGGMFCGHLWGDFMSERGILKTDLWCDSVEQDLWHAKLFPVVSHGVEGIRIAMWLMGVDLMDIQASSMRPKWLACPRLSFSDLHSHIHFKQLSNEVNTHGAHLAAGFLKASIVSGLLGRNFSQLCKIVILGNWDGVKMLHALKKPILEPGIVDSDVVPSSRVQQVLADIYEACGDSVELFTEVKIPDAIAEETSAAVGQSHMVEKVQENARPVICVSNTGVMCSKVELPVRLDIVGGWSDTPPWSLERTGCVLNMAVQLEGRSPVGAQVTLHATGSGVAICDDAGNNITLENPRTIASFKDDDKFILVKSALVVTGFTSEASILSSRMLEIRTWSDVPRGSGLGVSSILAAAVVKGLLEVQQGDTSSENVVRLVLVLEQIMGTGGGWQDQVGGVYPGVKCTTSMPGRPMRLKVHDVLVTKSLRLELESRLVVVFTGQVRSAHTVLQVVVKRYLQRDARLITAISRLAALAKSGKAALAANDLTLVGSIMTEAWLLHQELDPNCSNTFVDSLFRRIAHLSCGHKLVGAGGGGFAIVMGKSKGSAEEIKSILKSFGPPVQVYNWCLFEY